MINGPKVNIPNDQWSSSQLFKRSMAPKSTFQMINGPQVNNPNDQWPPSEQSK
ncbi:hypothetical protein DPMN_065984 [Dreissena polymorpha]|uniref:Uncharacterized protein n=1 Tax=Dreissena polymorpha TaxID=45954 RepID=A0A9D3YWW4_DREPO|nr:hypothetical protein DPMN_065984 [Dreissena polymorpha]